MNDSLDAQVAHWKAVHSASKTQTAFRLSQAVQVQQLALGLRGHHGTLQTIELPEPSVRWQGPEFLWGPALGHICLPKAFQVLTDFCSSNPGHTMLSVERPGRCWVDCPGVLHGFQSLPQTADLGLITLRRRI